VRLRSDSENATVKKDSHVLQLCQDWESTDSLPGPADRVIDLVAILPKHSAIKEQHGTLIQA